MTSRSSLYFSRVFVAGSLAAGVALVLHGCSTDDRSAPEQTVGGVNPAGGNPPPAAMTSQPPASPQNDPNQNDGANGEAPPSENAMMNGGASPGGAAPEPAPAEGGPAPDIDRAPEGSSEGGGSPGDSESSGAAGAGSGGSGSEMTPPPMPMTPAAPACPASANVTPGESNRTVNVGGANRSYLLHVPPGYTGDTPVAVVFDFHGLGGSGMGQRNLSRWVNVADREGFIMVYPNGQNNAWNVGRCCPPSANNGVDDVAFVRAIIAQLETIACIDERRVFASGCSNGGGMSYKLACEAADVIAGVAPVDFDCVVGPNNVPSCGGCNPSRPITEIQFRATNDALVAYEGGPAPIPQGMDFPGAEQNFSDWGEINSCTGTPQAVPGEPACQTFPSCGGGVATTLCTQQGGSHCGNYVSLDIANVAWAAFEGQAIP